MRNKTIKLTLEEAEALAAKVNISYSPSKYNLGYCLPCEDLLAQIESNTIDLIILDPPYNLNKKFGENKFREMSSSEYQEWITPYLLQCKRVIKKTGTIYVCGDWKSSTAIHNAAIDIGFNIVNRITWEREKGRGALRNWKSCSEDIWMLTLSDEYKFNVDKVKLKRKVVAPYKVDGKAKDWNEEGNFRLTFPSNIWTDITIPFWSMPENTEHPTQKPEKLIAKLMLASSDEDDLVLDLFAGSGTTSVVAKKLNRKFLYCESDMTWCSIAEKRLEMAETDKRIQGYDGEFLHRSMNA